MYRFIKNHRKYLIGDRDRMIAFFTLFFILNIVSSCAFIKSLTPFEQKEVTTTKQKDNVGKNVEGLTNLELEYKVSQLWSRIEDLEIQNRILKEHYELLRKGLMLGIIPEELKEHDRSPKNRHLGGDNQEDSKKNVLNEKKSTEQKKDDYQTAEITNSKDVNEYRTKLSEAQESFDSGQYGKAIVAYSDLEKNFGSSQLNGNHLFWIGLSWYYLKEYHLSEKNLQKFINLYPQNNWIPKAELYQAKIQINNGLRKDAIDTLKKMIQKYPNHQIIESAKLELIALRKNI